MFDTQPLSLPARAGDTSVAGSAPEVLRAYEWSADYRCRACGAAFNVADDSDWALQPQRAHACASLREQP